jgi:hypothetical protein
VCVRVCEYVRVLGMCVCVLVCLCSFRFVSAGVRGSGHPRACVHTKTQPRHPPTHTHRHGRTQAHTYTPTQPQTHTGTPPTHPSPHPTHTPAHQRLQPSPCRRTEPMSRGSTGAADCTSAPLRAPLEVCAAVCARAQPHLQAQDEQRAVDLRERLHTQPRINARASCRWGNQLSSLCSLGGTRGVLEGYSRGTHGVLEGYSRGTHGVLEGYSRGT